MLTVTFRQGSESLTFHNVYKIEAYRNAVKVYGHDLNGERYTKILTHGMYDEIKCEREESR